MVHLFMSPLSWLLRPVALPGIGAAFGLFYGTYDITLLTLGTIVGTKDADKCTFGHKVATFTSGVGLSAAALFVRLKFDPPPPIPKLDTSLLKDANFVTKYVRQSVHTLKCFPVVWYGSSIAAAGFVTGVTVSLTR